MKSKMVNYRILVEKEQNEGKIVYVAYAPSLGISDFGATVEQAVSHMEKGMKVYIQTLIDLGKPIPQPDSDDYFVTSRKIEVGKVAGVLQ